MRQVPQIGSRLLAILLLGYILSVFSTTFFAWYSVAYFRLQPMIIMVISAGFHLPLLTGGLVVLFLGYLNDIASGGVNGLQLTAYILVLCISVIAKRKLEISFWPFQMIIAGIMSLLFQLAVVIGVMLTNRQTLILENVSLIILSQTVFTALTAPIFFILLDLISYLFELH